MEGTRMTCLDDTLAAFYGIRLAAGEFIRQDAGEGQVMLNESAVRAMGISNPVGMTLTYRNGQKTRSSAWYATSTSQHLPFLFNPPFT